MNGRTRVALHGGVATFAAATALSSVFTNWGWLFPVTGAIIVVVLVSELVRWSPIPSGLSPLLAAAAVSCYLTATETSSRAYGGVFPTESSLRQLGAIARSGFHDVSALSTPVPTHRGLVLLATVGLAGVALVVDLFAATMRRAALAGLPLLAVFALSTAVAKHGVGWLPFVVATAGYLWLLLADSRDRLSRWGRPVGFDRDNRPRFTWSDQEVAPAPLSVMGRRIGFSAIAVAVVVPLLFPGLRGGVPQHNGNGLGFGGGSGASRVTLNPIVRIQAQLVGSTVRDVMTVTTSDPDPGYLRLTSLDRFDGTTFSPSTLQAPISAQVSRGLKPPLVAGKAVQSQISVSALSTPWLPVPQQVESVHVSGDWRFDPASDTIFSARNETDGLQYAVDSTKPDWTVAQLESATTIDPKATAMLQVPASVSSQVRTLTAHVLAVAHAVTPFDKAVAIQQYLTSPLFTYDVNVASSASSDALANFLLHTHRGFCQQYASAMAIMARIAGIPSRVAVGFTRGEQQPDGTWVVTTRDAHAWPELDFGGIGWVPFEPTPRTDGQTEVPNYAHAPVKSKPGKGGAPDQSQKIAAGRRGGKASAPIQSRAQLL
ncbi:MAG: transglutaminase domain-containing protein, partial [Frankiales bacterium]|nr:transglutaminase domain-containing protein [Frankiales bacterium]